MILEGKNIKLPISNNEYQVIVSYPQSIHAQEKGTYYYYDDDGELLSVDGNKSENNKKNNKIIQGLINNSGISSFKDFLEDKCISYVREKGYSIYLDEIKEDSEYIKELSEFCNKLKSKTSDNGTDSIDGHPWELIFINLFDIFKACKKNDMAKKCARFVHECINNPETLIILLQIYFRLRTYNDKGALVREIITDKKEIEVISSFEVLDKIFEKTIADAENIISGKLTYMYC